MTKNVQKKIGGFFKKMGNMVDKFINWLYIRNITYSLFLTPRYKQLLQSFSVSFPPCLASMISTFPKLSGWKIDFGFENLFHFHFYYCHFWVPVDFIYFALLFWEFQSNRFELLLFPSLILSPIQHCFSYA